MNLDYLRTYLEVIRLGNFSEVARKLSISQPAVSFQIQKLEQDLGVRLIDRSKKAVTMTEAGKRLLRFAESVEEERGQLRHDIDQLREEVTGNLVVTASTIPGEFLLPSILSEFKALHPAIRAQVVISDSLTVISGVRDGSYDVGFCGLAPEGQELESFKTAEDEIVLIVFPEHPFAERREVSPAELEGEPLIFREETSGTQQSLQTLLSKSGLDLSKWVPNLLLGTTQAVVSAVEARAGIAFVSNLAIKKSLALDLVKAVKVEGLTLKRDFFCIYRKERIVSRLLEEFITFSRGRSPQP
ncbi:MAG: LysR family transcriptional regulator [Dehalococcoidales bacterium]|nr:LysR family transcriptional regulator [Dehalococcoidales bacterium]